jgi:hypothetical protein
MFDEAEIALLRLGPIRVVGVGRKVCGRPGPSRPQETKHLSPEYQNGWMSHVPNEEAATA